MSSNIRLAQRIANAIDAGQYRPGEWLKQVELASEYGVTRFEVRKALEELTLRKAVVHTPEKGYRVSEASASDVAHARAVRIILETAAAHLVLERIDESGLKLLRRLAGEFSDAAENGTPAERNQANHRFHDAMYSMAGNPVLSEAIRAVRDQARHSPMYLWPSIQSLRQSVKDHDEIIDALAARDQVRLEAVISRHINKASGGEVSAPAVSASSGP